ncbi:hypothetical protein A2454_02980 [Candidatus Peribacteria bacterium RIFOXYC2_FULL_55_14]|nr:MAG: LuxR family transcriptional regulator [Candidatus Peribacteria bacterium GW2011_GWB1_54_5]OGJ71137.1 MAG: hypothetical protein A2198_01360 [Candidatus Peribacteria bacterium RIFOXYA1_FULL_56_14]OGJ73771.1 MAG: hypothetical protein A2384_04305 [Candidatus Peribacteria bacterium RIFOXYB1_FULL_54_35]OGJ74899.1 MAG: hypothetical protein A2217_02775 [Candidatus Peribacteria bacterium RIFOXYA2_FULL_55_28]OGJ77187.1 MAG: hypothetical protein A2327_05880 [Candidatus Peribacteria bacterium RIFOX
MQSGLSYPELSEEAMQETSIALAVDPRMLRESLAMSLKKTYGTVAALDPASDDAAASIVGMEPKIIIVTAHPTTLRIATEVRRNSAQTRALLLSPTIESALSEECLALAPEGCLPTQEETSSVGLGELHQAIRMLRTGHTFIPIEVLRGIYRRALDGAANKAATSEDPVLTPRELEIVSLLLKEPGLANKQIASRLHVSIYTVKNHIRNMLRKCSVPSRYRLIEHCRGKRNQLGAL